MEQLDEVPIDASDPDRTINIGSMLDPNIREHLLSFLRDNHDCFAWSHGDMPGIDPEVTTHRLNVDPSHKPVKQKRRKLGIERNKIVNDEVRRLIEAGFIKEV